MALLEFNRYEQNKWCGWPVIQKYVQTVRKKREKKPNKMEKERKIRLHFGQSI